MHKIKIQEHAFPFVCRSLSCIFKFLKVKPTRFWLSKPGMYQNITLCTLSVEQMMATFISSGIKGCSPVGKQIITIYSFYNWIAVILVIIMPTVSTQPIKQTLSPSLCCFNLLSLLFMPFVSGLGWKSTLFFVLSVNCESAIPYRHSRFLIGSSSFVIAGISWMIVSGQTFLYATLQRQ